MTNGWTGSPVVAARVSGNGIDAMTDGAGRIFLPDSPGCVAVTILAAGFLERRTCAAASLTLWPVESEAEAVATRAAAFYGERRRRYPYGFELILGPGLAERPGAVEVWTRAAAEVQLRTGNTIQFHIVKQPSGDDGYVVSLAGPSPSCRHGWFTWSFVPAGFCWAATEDYFVQNITVADELVTRPDVALRALAWGSALRQHSFPGLLNEASPASEFSQFELKTMRMLTLRSGTDGVWPDSDRMP